MIQDYLKTGMVFYDDPARQHFRNSCCKEKFCQFTDKNHFPSFQFSFDFPWAGTNYRIYDLDDNDISGVWFVGAGAPSFSEYHSGGDNYTFSHDFRDEVTYTAEVEYGTCYYLTLNVLTAAGYVHFYSEAFMVCDCEPDGIGDGENLIENGWFVDWVIVPPNAWDDYPLGWTLVNNDAANYVVDAGDECQMISNNTQALRIEQIILEIGKWYVVTINITAVAAGGIQIYEGGNVIAQLNTTGIHNIVFQATDTLIRIYRWGITNVTFTDFRVEEFIGFEFCDMMTLYWRSDCDWDRIIYHDGFINSLVLGDSHGAISLDTPSEDIVVNSTERKGEIFASNVVIKKRYKFNIRIPEYLWNVLMRLPAYGSEMPGFHCWITLPDGSACSMSEVGILGEWDVGNCMNTFTVEFVDDDEYPVVATNCCDEYDVSIV